MQTEIIASIFKIDRKPYELVPKAFLRNSEMEMSVDYHSGLLKLSEGDEVEIKLYLNEMPEMEQNAYVMSGIVYEVDDSNVKCSFGGLLLDYKGRNEDIESGAIIHASIKRI
ncbi:hypothetical protein ECANGB1_840 [Enterospora canceri]|uniref:Uncharacterized protein n=1 Tax=Enterospora canceri TaxID=1081671 RepID=A0A1Y1S7C9_9MICR|nr:hypothetical protein ECANGB1_840 [Enterospora canceri]